MNTSTVVATAVVIASVALQIDFIVYWIGPAGCVILIPALIMVLALPLLDEQSVLLKAKPKQVLVPFSEVPEVLTAAPLSHSRPNSGSELAVPNDYHTVPQPQLGLNERQLFGIKQLGQWIKSFVGPGSLSPARSKDFDMLDKAEKIKITEKIKPDGVRERSVMIFYRKV